MYIQLKNIGMIEEANIKLNGLTIIAGENDTGKSTVGKALFAFIKADNISRNQNDSFRKQTLATRLNLVFDGNVTNDGFITLSEDNGSKIIEAKITSRNFVSDFTRNNQHKERFFDATLIQSPIIFDMVDFFNSISRMKERQKFDYGLEFDITYPYVLWDLYDKISKLNPFPKAKTQENISENATDTINGFFKQESGQFFFYKHRESNENLKIEMANTAFGIKSFGLIQLLNENGFINPKYHLILDEPEVHLHPKWQLKYAEIVVALAQNGINILVNSHSPYMLEALKVFSDKAKISNMTNFYLAEKNSNGLTSNIRECTNSLMEIFDLLSKPLIDLEEVTLENSLD